MRSQTPISLLLLQPFLSVSLLDLRVIVSGLESPLPAAYSSEPSQLHLLALLTLRPASWSSASSSVFSVAHSSLVKCGLPVSSTRMLLVQRTLLLEVGAIRVEESRTSSCQPSSIPWSASNTFRATWHGELHSLFHSS